MKAMWWSMSPKARRQACRPTARRGLHPTKPPPPKPPPEDDAPEDQSSLPPPPGGVALTMLSPQARPAEIVAQAEDLSNQFASATQQAVAASLRPSGRPNGFSQTVQRALAAARIRAVDEPQAQVVQASARRRAQHSQFCLCHPRGHADPRDQPAPDQPAGGDGHAFGPARLGPAGQWARCDRSGGRAAGWWASHRDW